MNKLATIGYETDTQGGMIARLKAADVELVVDVRAVASSRKAGFSKTLLGNSLKDQGIDYLHLKPLGTPKPVGAWLRFFGAYLCQADHTGTLK